MKVNSKSTTSTETATKTAPRSRAGKRYPKILGHSACSVLKALGRAGVDAKTANRIMRKNGVRMPWLSLATQIRLGRNPEAWETHGKPAELSRYRIMKLRAMAGDLPRRRKSSKSVLTLSAK
jgi:hypothetical protein